MAKMSRAAVLKIPLVDKRHLAERIYAALVSEISVRDAGQMRGRAIVAIAAANIFEEIWLQEGPA